MSLFYIPSTKAELLRLLRLRYPRISARMSKRQMVAIWYGVMRRHYGR